MLPKANYAKHLTAVLAILCVFRVAAPAQTTNNEQIPPPPIGKLVDVGGYRVHLYCTGSGSPAVVIVGAALSFDWGLVQPEVAKFNQVCPYDHSGISWSDSGPKDSCSLRVTEVHTALKNAGINGPYVLVGHSLGALVARVYAGQYPDEVAGLVFVDHAAFSPRSGMLSPPPSDAKVSPPAPHPIPTTPSSGPGVIGIEGDPNFSKLSDHERDLHLWAMAQPRYQKAFETSAEIRPGCVAAADAISKGGPHLLGDKPLVDIRTTNEFRSQEYEKLQTDLLSLSRNSKELIAEKSGHFVIIDRPDVVIDGVRQAVQSVRNKTKL